MDLYSEAYATTHPEDTDKKEWLAGRGKFYSLVGQVFGEARERVEFVGGLNAIRRTKTNRHYRVVLNEIGLIEKTHTNSKGDCSSKSSVLRSDKLRSRQNPRERGGKFDMLGATGGEDAHAVPDSARCAPSYGPFLQCVMGLNLDLPEMNDEHGHPIRPLSLERLRAASQRIDEINGKSDGIQMGSRDEESQLRKKIMKHIANDSEYAVKNLLINKTRVPGPHKVFYDTNPGFFVLPCMSPNDAKEWTPGKEYEVVMICNTERAARQMIGIRGFTAREEGRVASEAKPGDLNNARNLLTATIKALAESATREKCVRPFDLIDREDSAAREMTQVLAELGNGTVLVPEKHVAGVNVLKVKLQHSLDYEVPDPMLLAMKAAINWYYMMTGLKLLPACKPPEDPRKEEIRIANEELCDELREQDLRPETWEELAKGLGQPLTPDNRPARVSSSPAGKQETTEKSDLDSTNKELSPRDLLALYDEIDEIRAEAL